ncbi:UNVERIFIED_CONTAM: hypothetical protein GTU68_056406 [Idotea baltica]|nr:hypothetical protein [Idotea baltica]
MKILQLLESAPEKHMSVDFIYKALLGMGEDVGLATIYRVLAQFEAAGLVVKHSFDDIHAMYELSGSEHHDHIVCVDTDEIIEFFDPDIEALQRAVVEKLGFKLIDHSMVLYVQKDKK